MSFIVQNNGFICLYCTENNPPAPKTCRNHCRKCFCSKHVDDIFPGDRASACFGKMRVKNIFYDEKNDFIFLHECEKCKKCIKNKASLDDDRDMLFEILQKIRKERGDL